MKTKKILTIILTLLLLLLQSTPFVQAATSDQQGWGSGHVDMGTSPIDNPNSFKPGGITTDDTEVITQKASTIVGIIVTVGVIASALTLLVLGIKYMLGSVSEKAEYKKSMAHYLVGAVLLF